MEKLKEDLRVGILGAASGLFAISVALMIARINAYYDYLSWLDETHYEGSYGAVESLWWIPAAIWHLILSITASLLAHRHLISRLRSPFLLWQAVGIASLFGWGLTFLLIVGITGVMNGNLFWVQDTFDPTAIAAITQYVSVAFACNVFFGSVMKVCCRQYITQFDEKLLCES